MFLLNNGEYVWVKNNTYYSMLIVFWIMKIWNKKEVIMIRIEMLLLIIVIYK